MKKAMLEVARKVLPILASTLTTVVLDRVAKRSKR